MQFLVNIQKTAKQTKW